MELVGIAVALGAALLFGTGIVIQARESRRVSAEHTMRVGLIVRLARSGRWLAGTVLTLLGWGLQALALGLAPITVVQPLLGLTLVVVLALGWWMGDRVRLADASAIGVLAAGATALVLTAPGHPETHTEGVRLVAPLLVLAAVALAPLLAGRATPVPLAAIGAGTAFALCGIATKLLSDSVAGHRMTAAVLALSVVAAAAAAGGISEMSALQAGAVARVVATVFAAEIALPVLLAPVMFGDSWQRMGNARLAALLTAVSAVLAGTTMLARAEGIAAATTPVPPSRVPTSS